VLCGAGRSDDARRIRFVIGCSSAVAQIRDAARAGEPISIAGLFQHLALRGGVERCRSVLRTVRLGLGPGDGALDQQPLPARRVDEKRNRLGDLTGFPPRIGVPDAKQKRTRKPRP